MKPRDRALLGQIADVDLRLLRVFKAVADCGSMAAAELELNIAISTISRHVKDLEQRLGLVLCRRGRAGFALTPEGEQVYASARSLLAATDAFRTGVHELSQRVGGDLHLALFEKCASNPAAHVDAALQRFRALAPEVRLHLHVGTITMIERGVMDGRYHLGVIPQHRSSESLRYDDLFEEQMLLYAGPGHPWFEPGSGRDWRALAAIDLAGLDYHSPNLEVAHTHQLRRAATASDQEGVAMLVMSGAFVGFLPDHYAAPFVREGRLKAVSPGVLNYRCRFLCIHRYEPPPTRAAEAFRACLVAAHG